MILVRSNYNRPRGIDAFGTVGLGDVEAEGFGSKRNDLSPSDRISKKSKSLILLRYFYNFHDSSSAHEERVLCSQ